MNFLLTGATGFIGQHITTQLLANNHHIVVLVRPESKAKLKKCFPTIQVIESDLSNPTLVDLPFPPATYHLIHLAWGDLPNYHSMLHLESHLMLHYFFIKQLIQQGIQNISITGTCFEYGLQNGALAEDTHTDPQNPYAMAKDFLHKMLYQLNLELPFTLKWLRLWYMFSPSQDTKSLISQLQNAIDSGKKEFKMSQGEQLRDYLPVERVADLIIKIAALDSFSGVVNICSGKPISIIKLIEDYLKDTKQVINLCKGAYPYNTYEPMAFWGDAGKLRRLTGGGGTSFCPKSTFIPHTTLLLVNLSSHSTSTYTTASRRIA